MKLTGRPNGYFGNPDIKILMPSNLRTLEKGLRMVGYGPKVDDFVSEHESGGGGGRSGSAKNLYRCHHCHDFR